MQRAIDELNEMQRLYSAGKMARDIALDQCGIGSTFAEELKPVFDAGAKFCGNLQSRIVRQAVYNATTNVPCHVLSREAAYDAEETIQTALAGACGELIGWDCSKAMMLAAAILEDVNCHPEAAELRATVQKWEQAA